jgi:hypothetical protein
VDLSNRDGADRTKEAIPSVLTMVELEKKYVKGKQRNLG